MSEWAQNSNRVKALKDARESDYDRWSRLDSHNPGWVNRVKLAVKFIPDGAKVLELGAGQALMQGELGERACYQPSDIVPHKSDFLVLDLNRHDPIPSGFDIIVALGVLEYIYDVPLNLDRIAKSAGRTIFTYCCKTESSDVSPRLNQGWLSDLTAQDVDDAITEAHLKIVNCTVIQETPTFTQIFYVADSLLPPGK